MSDYSKKRNYSQKIPFTEKAIEFEVFEKEEEKNKEDREDGDWQIDKWDLSFRTKKNMDHGGFDLEFSSLDSEYLFSFYDTRHWNSEEGRYYKKGEQIHEFLKTSESEDYKTKWLRDWIENYELKDDLKSEFGKNSLNEVLNEINRENPHLVVFRKLFPKLEEKTNDGFF